MQYQHTQIGTFIIAMMVIVVGVMTVVPIPPGQIALMLIVLAAAFAQFYSLSVEINEGTLKCSFGIGLISKRIPLSDIQSAEAVKNPWWVGWGIRWVPGQYWLWNISGFRAVELTLADGKRFRIGTDEPEVLAAAIMSNKGMERSAKI